ncbi:LamG-like jellyroll fold domain-containing protein [Dyadobacter fermentans]|uniref:LamG domain protein jellyroll fold domain protein n=1 Tax=Dyadobacter fermentans (strain ATCC 700827 / DSM 18053 / CIP 107007 / KCTC 52180 / NS114) TaxID=471854 RepID=C6W5Q6_DYAFD|nr:LamG-like jellyroll fold domain-containing protein [Dyadobacter fermentans]ACT95995.1 hypothetical protein Dfer_4794 [Dyadobacter fermentans DSM 18053]
MNLLRGILTMFLTVCAAISVHGEVDLNRGLIGCYPFSGNARDFSPMGNDGTVRGAQLATDRFGNPDAAYQFDGIDDVIEISPKDLQINTFTYSIWVNPDVIPAPSTALFLFSVGSSFGDQHILFGDHYSDSRHTGFSHGSYLGVANNVLCSGASIEPIGKWYHLVLVKTETDYLFYINGRMVCSNSVNGQKAFYGTGVVRATIGARNNEGQAAHARIDDIHLYNRPLNEEEIAALYQGPEVQQEPVKGGILRDNKPICGGNTVALNAVSDRPGGIFKWVVDGAEQSESSAQLMLATEDRGAAYTIHVGLKVDFDRSCFVQPEPFEVISLLEVNACANPPEETSRLHVPDIFTPNEDGKNDSWKIYNTDSIKDFRLMVFNRWGEVIYASKSGGHEWDGTYRGKVVPSGSYAFRILSGEKLIQKGSVMVVY